ncbi:MAG: acyl-CoA thioesterase [Nostocoides sp.]
MTGVPIEATDPFYVPPYAFDRLSQVLDLLQVRQQEPGRFEAPTADEMPMASGGILVGQAILAARHWCTDADLQSVQATFLRSGRTDQPVTIQLTERLRGRSLVVAGVEVVQGDRDLMAGTIVLSRPGPDTLVHAASAPPSLPNDHHLVAHGLAPWQVWEPTPPRSTRQPDGNIRLELSSIIPVEVSAIGPLAPQAVLAHFLETLVQPTIIRAWSSLEVAGVGGLPTRLAIANNLTCHGSSIPVGEPIGLVIEGVHAGHGRFHGRAQVFDAGGAIVASLDQSGVLR